MGDNNSNKGYYNFMDARMQSSVATPNKYQTWDYYVSNGIVPIIDGVNEQSQSSTIASYIQRNTIPQLPGIGVPWVEFFTGQTDFNTVDGAIKSALNSLGLSEYYPEYEIVNDNLICKVRN